VRDPGPQREEQKRGGGAKKNLLQWNNRKTGPTITHLRAKGRGGGPFAKKEGKKKIADSISLNKKEK